MLKATSIGDYLIQRLYAHGVRHVFGIPGDYVLGFYEQLLRTRAYASAANPAPCSSQVLTMRSGLRRSCVTYCVGGLKVANSTAEAFAEKSPVVIISGAPGMKEREKNP